MFRKLSHLYRRITGSVPQQSLADLCKYIKPGNIDHLAYWICQCIEYKSDINPADECEDLDIVIRRGSSDCEEKGGVADGVIKSWNGWRSSIVYMIHANPDNNHAICYFEGPRLKGVIDNSRVLYADSCERLREMVARYWPTTLYYQIHDSKGKHLSDKIFL